MPPIKRRYFDSSFISQNKMSPLIRDVVLCRTCVTERCWSREYDSPIGLGHLYTGELTLSSLRLHDDTVVLTACWTSTEKELCYMFTAR